MKDCLRQGMFVPYCSGVKIEVQQFPHTNVGFDLGQSFIPRCFRAMMRGDR